MSTGNETSNIRYVTAGQSLITMNDDVINCDSAGGAIVLVLPNIQGSGILSSGKCFKINDTSNTAATNNITIVAIGGNKVNDANTVVISTNGQSGYVKCLGLNDYLYDSPVAGGMGGSGTLNYVAKFTPDGSSIGNSQIFDNGTNVAIGTTTPISKLQVNSGITTTDDVSIFGFSTGGGGAFYSTAVQAFTSTSTANQSYAVFGRNVSSNNVYHFGGLFQSVGDNALGVNIGLSVLSTNNGGGKSFAIITYGGYNGFANDGYTFEPTAMVHIKGTDATSSNYALKVEDSASNPLLHVRNDGVISMVSLSTYADNAAALAGGLTAGMVYKTATGELRIVV